MRSRLLCVHSLKDGAAKCLHLLFEEVSCTHELMLDNFRTIMESLQSSLEMIIDGNLLRLGAEMFVSQFADGLSLCLRVGEHKLFQFGKAGIKMRRMFASSSESGIMVKRRR